MFRIDLSGSVWEPGLEEMQRQSGNLCAFNNLRLLQPVAPRRLQDRPSPAPEGCEAAATGGLGLACLALIFPSRVEALLGWIGRATAGEDLFTLWPQGSVALWWGALSRADRLFTKASAEAVVVLQALGERLPPQPLPLAPQQAAPRPTAAARQLAAARANAAHSMVAALAKFAWMGPPGKMKTALGMAQSESLWDLASGRLNTLIVGASASGKDCATDLARRLVERLQES